MNKIVLSSVVFLAFVTSALAQEAAIKDSKSIAKVRAELVKMIPDAETAEIEKSPIPKVYRMKIQGKYAFVHVNQGHIMIGDLYDVEQKVNLGDQASNDLMAKTVNEIPSNKMIAYGPSEPKRFITIFTDIDCGYCRKLHDEVPELNAAGIQVRYLAYPRAGINSGSYNKYVSVWCNEDQQQALTDSKAGKAVPDATCENPISESFELGKKVGVRGTPTMVLDDGSVIPGYVPAKKLIEDLGLTVGATQ